MSPDELRASARIARAEGETLHAKAERLYTRFADARAASRRAFNRARELDDAADAFEARGAAVDS